MDESFEKRLISYRLIMSIANEMLGKDIISNSDYDHIRSKMSEKYGVSGSIYS